MDDPFSKIEIKLIRRVFPGVPLDDALVRARDAVTRMNGGEPNMDAGKDYLAILRAMEADGNKEASRIINEQARLAAVMLYGRERKYDPYRMWARVFLDCYKESQPPDQRAAAARFIAESTTMKGRPARELKGEKPVKAILINFGVQIKDGMLDEALSDVGEIKQAVGRVGELLVKALDRKKYELKEEILKELSPWYPWLRDIEVHFVATEER